MPTTVILGTGIIGLSTAYYLSQLAETEVDSDATPTLDNPSAGSGGVPHRAKHEIHLVEPAPELFASASGKAAGFLAKDWFAPAVAPLGEFSFDLHRKLAEEHGGRDKWAWSEAVSYSLDREESDSETDDEGDEDEDEDVGEEGQDGAMRREKKEKTRNDLDWLMSGSSRATLLDSQRTEASSEAAVADAQAAAVDANRSAEPSVDDEEHPRWVRAQRSAMQVISDRTSTSQVDPLRLCQFLLQECLARGVKLHHPAHATQLLTEPASSDSSERTVVRLQFLGPDPEAAFTTSGTPNSKSPSTDAATNAKADSTQRQPNDRPSHTLRPAGNSRSPPLEEGWQSFSSSLDTEGSPTRHAVNTVEEDYVSYGLPSEKQYGDAAASEVRTLDVPCDSLVIAAGCWTPRVYRTLFPNAGRIPRVTALAGHSVVVKSRKWMSEKSRRKLQAKLGAPADAFLSAHPDATSPSGDSSTSFTSSSSADSTTLDRLSPAPSLFSRSSSYSSATTASPGVSSPTPYPPLPYPGVTHAVFTSDRAGYSPEIFSRLSGDVWIGGLNSSSIPLPPLPTMAELDAEVVAQLVRTAEALLGPITPSSSSPSSSASSPSSSGEQGVEEGKRRPALTLLRSALCFRPVAPTGRPVIARMHEADLGDGVRVPGGVFVATGHGPWGISLGLGTGWIVGEMVLGRETSVDVATLGRWEAGVP